MTRPRIATLTLAALLMSVTAPTLGGQGHPHDSKETVTGQTPNNSQAQTSTVTRYENDTLTSQGVEAEAETELQTQDFDINDFLGADGYVDVEKLRAYEAGKVDYIAENSGPNFPEDNMTEIGVTDIVIFEPQIHSDAPDADENPMSAEEYANISKYGQSTAMSANTHSADPQPLDLPVKETINRLIGDVKPKFAPPRLLADPAKPMHKGKTIYQNHHRETRGETVTLSGETTVYIAQDGSVTVTNNGDTVLPLSLSASQSGKASAMIIDDGKPAKVMVKKTVKTEYGKRRVHVEVEMESEALD